MSDLLKGARRRFGLVLVVLIAALPAAEALAASKVGILIFTGEVRLNDSRKGIQDQLAEDGFKEPAVEYVIENAGGSKARAAELAQRFSKERMDLVFTIGTHAAIPAVNAIQDVPIVFSMVYDPVEAGIAAGWQSSGNNTTGSTTKFPAAIIVKTLTDFTPVKRLAVLYTPGEKNSESQLKELLAAQVAAGIKVIPIILSNKEEVARSLAEVANTAEAFYLTGSSIIGETVSTIVEIATRAKIVTITHLDDLVEKGVLIGVCPNSYAVGRLAGRKAVMILRGAKPASIPIETDQKLDVILNMKTAQKGKFPISEGFMKEVTKQMR
jgi:putative tryptophan/tyrosine transport system substrate-binding protein